MAENERMQGAGDPAALRIAPAGDVASDPATTRLPRGWDDPVRLDEDPAVVPDPAAVEVPAELRRTIELAMRRYPDRHSAALPALAAAQRVYGWCSPEALRQVAAVMQVTPAYLSSLVTFYDMLRDEPVGSRYVYVCTSVSCHLRDAKAVYDATAEAAREQGLDDVEIRESECLGACDMAPMASVDGRYVGPLDRSDAREIVSALRERRAVLPGRGLEDSNYRLPWDSGPDVAQSAGPDARPDEVRPAGESPGGASGEPPTHPDVSPAGGTWGEAAAGELEERP